MAATSVQARSARVNAAKAGADIQPRGFMVWANWTGLLFALLQGLCTFFAAANGLRTVIGLGAIALTASQAAFISEFHSSAFRRPMNGLAVALAVLNLVVLWQIRRLRARPAAQWRVQPASTKKLRGERVQMAMAVLTLVLVGIEEYLHLTQHGRL